MIKILLLLSLIIIQSFNTLSSQLIIDGGTVKLGDNAAINIPGDMTSNRDISGTGKIIMKGISNQKLNMNGYSIPNLEINSTANLELLSNARITNNLLFTSGKIQTNTSNLILAPAANVSGAGSGKFVETNNTGELRKEINTAGNYDLPVGTGSHYMPLQYQINGSAISSGAYVGTRLIGKAHPHKHIRATDYIAGYWNPSYSGITGGSINAVATYVEGSGINGDETVLNGIKWNGSDWSLENSSINHATNSITFNSVANGTDELYAMNKFVLMNAKVFLQGAYNSTAGKMTDNLRQAPNLIPFSDPYRTAPYNTFFTHTNNTSIEVTDTSVFNTQPNDDDNIVDWVFVELRNASNQLMQTRSALLQKDGDVVDVDGVNPVFFKNLDAGNYVITVRHRNHLGLSADAATNAKTLSVAKPTAANLFDMTTLTDAQLFGDAAAYTTSSHPTLGTVNLLWGGNLNLNSDTRYSGPQNDNSYLLNTLLSGNASLILTLYSPGDINLNRTVRYSGPGNDNTFLLTSILNGNSGKIINQQIPD